MKYMLDTDICIYMIKNCSPALLEKILSCDRGDICVSEITHAELEYGVQKSKCKAKNKEALIRMLADFDLIGFGGEAAEEYGEIKATLESEGKPIGPNDLLIAAQAKSLGLTLVTNNTREFQRVPGLKIENWA